MVLELLGKVIKSNNSLTGGEFFLKRLLKSLGKCFQGPHNTMKIVLAREHLADDVCQTSQLCREKKRAGNRWSQILRVQVNRTPETKRCLCFYLSSLLVPQTVC